MCLEEIGLHAQNMLIILVGSVINILRDLCDHLISTRIFTLIVNKIFMWTQHYWVKGYMHDLDILHPMRSG